MTTKQAEKFLKELDKVDKDNYCPLFIGAGNELHGIRDPKHLDQALQELEEIKGLTDLPVYKVEHITSKHILLEKLN